MTLAGVALTVAVTYAFSRYELREGRRIGSPSLVADAQHVRTDMFSSLAILVGLAGSAFGLPLDRPAALVVVGFIAHAGWEVLRDSVRVLLDASLDFETLEKVKGVILSHPKVREVKGLWGRNSGRYKFIEAEITVNEVRLDRAHRVAQELEDRIREEIPNVDHILIHYEPIRKEVLRYAFPTEDEKGRLSEHFGEAPYFVLVTVRASDGEVLDRQVFPNEFLDVPKGKGILVSEWLAHNGVDFLYIKKPFHGKGPQYVLSDSGIGVLLTEAETVDELLRQPEA